MRTTLTTVFLLAVALSVGCGGETTDNSCIPGESASCTCTNGGQGAQTCRDDGTFAECVCVGPGPDASQVDAGPLLDAVPSPDGAVGGDAQMDGGIQDAQDSDAGAVGGSILILSVAAQRSVAALGSTFSVAVQLQNPGTSSVIVDAVELTLPVGFSLTPGPLGVITPGSTKAVNIDVLVDSAVAGGVYQIDATAQAVDIVSSIIVSDSGSDVVGSLLVPEPTTRTPGLGNQFAFDGSLVYFLVPESGSNVDLNGDGDILDSVVHAMDTSTPTVAPVNSGVSAYTLYQSDSGAYSLVRESAEGRDLNGDGDLLDQVIHYWLAPGAPVNLGMPGGGDIIPAGTRLFFTVDESAHFATDLNGDGDAIDRVPHVWDSAIPATPPQSSGVQAAGIVVAGTHAVFTVSETENGDADLNGDGDSTDRVLFDWNGATPATPPRSSGLARFVSYAVQTTGSLVVFSASECQSGQDLNGDGDEFDAVLHVWDISNPTSVSQSSNLADGSNIQGGSPVACGSSSSTSFTRELSGTKMFFTVFESSQGGADLNGDGDSSDHVVHVWDAATPGTPAVNSGISGAQLVATAGFVFFEVAEQSEANTDLNGDGDTQDRIVHAWDGTSSTVFSAAHALDISQRIVVSDGVAYFGVSESSDGQDLNGDSDLVDSVLFAWNTTTAGSGPTNLGFALASSASLPSFVGVSDRVFFRASESSQASSLGGLDLNGDGDRADTVLMAWNASTPSVPPISSNTAVSDSSAGRMGTSNSAVYFAVSETNDGNSDHTGDGTVSGDVLSTWNGVTLIHSHLRVGLPARTFPLGGVAVALEGPADLNGDGDLADQVLTFLGEP